MRYEELIIQDKRLNVEIDFFNSKVRNIGANQTVKLSLVLLKMFYVISKHPDISTRNIVVEVWDSESDHSDKLGANLYRLRKALLKIGLDVLCDVVFKGDSRYCIINNDYNPVYIDEDRLC